MHVPHDRLPDRGPVIVIAAVMSLFLVLCIMVMLPSHIVPRFGGASTFESVPSN